MEPAVSECKHKGMQVECKETKRERKNSFQGFKSPLLYKYF